MNSEVCIVCDWKDVNPFPIFIEAEVDGKSVRFDWRDRADGLKELVIPTPPPIAQQGGVEVTDAMVEAAARAMMANHHYAPIGTPDGNTHWRGHGDSYRRDARTAIETALASKADGVRNVVLDGEEEENHHGQ